MRLAENSIHKSAENELDLADSLTEAALHSSDDRKSKDYAKEAILTIQKTHRENSDQNIKIQSKLIESRAYHSINDEKNAEKSLESAQNRLKKSGNTSNLRTQLELAKSYLVAGQKEQANDLLSELAIKYKDDPEISAKLDKIVDEPITESGKNEVIAANKEGIKMFEAAKYLEAVKCFLKATKNSPKHIGLRLNIVQSLIFQMKITGLKKEILHQCDQHLSIVMGISHDHPQYIRYSSIRKTLETINKNSETGDKNG